MPARGRSGVWPARPWPNFVQGEAFLGDLLALAGALMAAAYILIGRSLRGKMSLIPYIFVVYGMAALVLVALMLGAGQPATGYPAPAYGWFLLLAIFPSCWAIRPSIGLCAIYLPLMYPSPCWGNRSAPPSWLIFCSKKPLQASRSLVLYLS
jgi:drug/metabolite transporter (DMT)-like permease